MKHLSIRLGLVAAAALLSFAPASAEDKLTSLAIEISVGLECLSALTDQIKKLATVERGIEILFAFVHFAAIQMATGDV